ncbi:MAG: hypothetical protein RIS64_4379 [Bacteroidota bacterium]|jgi:AAA15 family ATPase/GTPase
MLLYFTIQNSRSFEQAATLSLIAGQGNELPQNIQKIESYDFTLLKSAILYGANASGKTNFLKALADGTQIIKFGLLNTIGDTFEDTPTESVKARFYPNKNKELNLHQPSEYRYGVLLNGQKYEYRFSVNDVRIVEERLIRYDADRKYPTTLFVRLFDGAQYNWSFADGLKTPQAEIFRSIQLSTTKTKLWISEVERFSEDYEALLPEIRAITHFLTKQLVVFIHSDNPDKMDLIPTLLMIYKNKELKAHFMKIIKLADFKIQDIDVTIKEKKDTLKIRARTIHKGYDPLGIEKTVYYDLQTENSQGTNRFIAWLAPFFDALIHNKVLIIDEFGNSMHPAITQLLIQLFHDTRRNAQIIFSTHYTELMDETLFRTDQIWLVNKDTKGNSTLEALSNYEIPAQFYLDRLYRNGLFRGRPFVTEHEIQKVKKVIPIHSVKKLNA